MLCDARDYVTFSAATDAGLRNRIADRIVLIAESEEADLHAVLVDGDETDPDTAASLLREPGAEHSVAYAYVYSDTALDPQDFAETLTLSGGARYVCWNSCLGEDMGFVRAYGEGTANGEVAYRPVAELPADADLFYNVSDFFLEGIEFTPELIKACRQLSISAGTAEPEKGLCRGGRYASPDLCLGGPWPFFTLNHILLPDPEAVKTFAARMSEVLRLTGQTEFEAEFLDIPREEPRMFRLKVYADGTAEYAVSAEL